jgi:hypothetical protein
LLEFERKLNRMCLFNVAISFSDIYMFLSRTELKMRLICDRTIIT